MLKSCASNFPLKIGTVRILKIHGLKFSWPGNHWEALPGRCVPAAELYVVFDTGVVNRTRDMQPVDVWVYNVDPTQIANLGKLVN